ncbi:MAG: DUF2079 domain-containing protein, partial [Myxococcota bacterium]
MAARYLTFHNATFDLAFYARMAWGLSGNDFWEPLVDAHVFGLHLSPILVPLGLLGRLTNTVAVLMVAQSAAIGGTGLVLGRLGKRWLGPHGGWLGVLALVAHPNALHAATYEVHPGTMALLPMAWALERLDAQDRRGVVLACLGVLACREDLALVTACIGALAFGFDRRLGAGVMAGSLAYLAYFLVVLFPAHAPDTGSFELHFGKWGASFGEVFQTWWNEPGTLVAHLAQPRKLSFLPRAILPWALLPLLAPRWWLPALPTLAIAQLSDFPTTPDLDSHYLTPALPALAVAALAGLRRLTEAPAAPVRVAVVVTMAIAVLVAGPLPTDAAFWPDETTRGGRAVVEAVEARDASLGMASSFQGADALLAHVAERRKLYRGPPPERGADFVAFDARHRQDWAHDETLLRTDEEEPLRAWLARPDHEVVLAAGPYLLLARGGDPRAGLAAPYFVEREGNVAAEGAAIAACLHVEPARRDGDVIELLL